MWSLTGLKWLQLSYVFTFCLFVVQEFVCLLRPELRHEECPWVTKQHKSGGDQTPGLQAQALTEPSNGLLQLTSTWLKVRSETSQVSEVWLQVSLDMTRPPEDRKCLPLFQAPRQQVSVRVSLTLYFWLTTWSGATVLTWQRRRTRVWRWKWPHRPGTTPWGNPAYWAGNPSGGCDRLTDVWPPGRLLWIRRRHV